MSKKIQITLLWFAIVATCGLYLWINLLIVSDFRQFMPTDSNDKNAQIILNQSQSTIESSLIFAKISSPSDKISSRVSQQLKSALIAQSDKFDFINNGDGSIDFDKFESILKYRYLLNKPPSFSTQTLSTSFENILDKFQLGSPDRLIDYLLIDPQMSLFEYISLFDSNSKLKSKNGVWFVDNNAFMMIKLNENLSEKNNIDAIGLIRDEFDVLPDSKTADLLLIGPSVVASDARNEIQDTIQLVSWVLTIVILLLFLLLYRSVYLSILAGVPLVFSIVITMAIVQFIFGNIHGIVLAFGITTLGVCIDYSLHFFSHINKDEDIGLTFRKVWPTIRLGALTSILAYAALIGTGFSGLTQLAVFSSVGLLVALLASFYLLPIWVKHKNINIRYIQTHAPLAFNTKILLSFLFIVLPLLFLLINNGSFSSSVSQINPSTYELKIADKEAREVTGVGGINNILLISGNSIQDTLSKTEEVQANLQSAINNDVIKTSYSASDILPSHNTQKYYQSLLPDKDTLINNISLSIQNMPIKLSAFDKFINDVSQSKSANFVNYENIKDSILGNRIKSMLFKSDNKWYSIISLSGVDNTAFYEWLKINPNVGNYHYSISKIANNAIDSYQRSTWIRIVIALLILLFAVIWWSKEQKNRIWIIVPVLSGVLITLTVQILLGNHINMFHMLSLLLVIGMGFDYSLFFNRNWDNKLQLQRRTHAITISAVTTISAFLVLALSDIVVLSSIGQIVVVGIAVCFISAKFISLPLMSVNYDKKIT